MERRASSKEAADAIIRAGARMGSHVACDPGFDHTVLSELRTRHEPGAAEQRLLDVVLEQCQARGWLKARRRQRTDATPVLAAVRALNRVECVGETLRHALNVLAEVAPDWLRPYMAQAHPEWANPVAQERAPVPCRHGPR